MNNMSLSKRVALDVFLAVLICVVSVSVFSFMMQRGEIIEESANRALAIARTVSAALDPEQYAAIMDSGETNEYYDAFTSFIDRVLQENGAIYLYVLDSEYDSEVTYFAEGFVDGYSPDEEYFFGATETADVFSEEMYETLATGADSPTGIYNLGGFGDMISGFSPIKDGSGAVLGVVGVDILIDEAMATVNRTGLYMLLVAVAACALVMFIALVTIRKTFTPLKHLSSAMNQIGAAGNLVFSKEVMDSAQKTASWRNEIGVCAKAFDSTLNRLRYLESTLKAITGGDLSVNVTVLSDRDEIGSAISGLVEQLNALFAQMLSGSERVASSAGRVADDAKGLAGGAERQSASIGELSGSMAEITEKTKTNATKAEQAAKLAEAIKENAEKGGRQMDDMARSVRDINESSQAISKVIKTIDDIAFQTNILALNAAVEAARAGQHGKGFAVVAEEVRNLATKSAEAAKDTEKLIADSREKAEHGARISGNMSLSLEQIVQGISESSSLIREIADATEGQTFDITKINTGIDQVAKIVEQNNAAARDSTGASEEMSGQAEILLGLVSRFRLKSGGEFEEFAKLSPGSSDISVIEGY